jgi:uncharacterized protein (DUF2062 family)
MPRRVFKPLSRQRHFWKERWFMRPFRLLLENPSYWSLNRRNVTRAVAMGLFISWIPLPIHIPLAAALALLLRLNIPAAVTATLIANPLTLVPMYYFAYWIGCRVLQLPPGAFAFEPSWDWITTGLLPIWKPFLLGCLIMAAFTSVMGYIALGTVWHLTLLLKYHKRKSGPEAKSSEIGEE